MMNFLYNTSLWMYEMLLQVAAIFHPKARLWVSGRKHQKDKLANYQSNVNQSNIWVHCASLGEFEQGRPVIETIKEKNPNCKIVLSFYSPSGYEIRKYYDLADLVVYLPLDRPKKVKQFLNHIRPTQAIFVKYEIWPNYFHELYQRKIPLYLVSAIFSENQRFFKSSAKKWFSKPLHQVTRFFVQNTTSKDLLATLGIKNVDITGDTRFDRVLNIVSQNKKLEKLAAFVEDHTTVILGSSWPEDEQLLKKYLEHQSSNFKTIIAPHEIHASRIANLASTFGDKAVLYSTLPIIDISSKDIVIMDNMGKLSQAYSSADIAIIGGGFGKGIHNTLEAAAYGIPLLFGPNYQKFQEAKDLIALGAASTISNQTEFDQAFTTLLTNEPLRHSKGGQAKSYVSQGKGATKAIVDYILPKD